MNSIIGRNVQYCCEKCGINFDSVINGMFSLNDIYNLFFASSIKTIDMVHELILCIDGTFRWYLCNDSFDKTDSLCINNLCNSLICLHIVFMFLFPYVVCT